MKKEIRNLYSVCCCIQMNAEAAMENKLYYFLDAFGGA